MTMAIPKADALRRLRAAAVERGLCYTCRVRCPRPGIRNCDHCIERCKLARRGKPRTPTKVAYNIAYMKRRRAESLAIGRCQYCHRYDSAPDRTMCFGCLRAMSERALKRRQRGAR